MTNLQRVKVFLVSHIFSRTHFKGLLFFNRSSFRVIRFQIKAFCHPHERAMDWWVFGWDWAFRLIRLVRGNYSPEAIPALLGWVHCLVPETPPHMEMPTGSSIVCGGHVWISICSWLPKLWWPCVKSYLFGGWINIALRGICGGLWNSIKMVRLSSSLPAQSLYLEITDSLRLPLSFFLSFFLFACLFYSNNLCNIVHLWIIDW